MYQNITLLDFTVNLLITSLAYLFIPGILIIQKKRYSISKIKKIIIANSLVCWVIFQIITISATGESHVTAAVFIWGGIGYALLKKYCNNSAPVIYAIETDNVIPEKKVITDPQKNNTIEKTEEKASFLDEFIVFTIEGDDKHYYTYDQMMEATDKYDEFSFYAYNIDHAKSLGFKPIPNTINDII